MTSLEEGRDRRVCEGTDSSTRSLLLFGSVAGVGRALSKVLCLLEMLDGVEQHKEGQGVSPRPCRSPMSNPSGVFCNISRSS